MADRERRTPTAADLDAKREAIEAFFEDFEERISFANRLYSDGRRREALILACAYVEGMGTYLYYPRAESKRNFTKILIEHGEDPRLGLVHPRLLLDSIRGKSTELAAVAAKVEARLATEPFELRSFEDTIAVVEAELTSGERKLLKRALWLGSLAAAAYQKLRIPFSHRGAGPIFVEFSNSQFAGDPAPTLDFEMLRDALVQIVSSMKTLSTSTNSWFGHD